MFVYKHTEIIEYVKNSLYGWIIRELVGFRIRNFQDIIFIWTETYGEIFKSAFSVPSMLVLLTGEDSKTVKTYELF